MYVLWVHFYFKSIKDDCTSVHTSLVALYSSNWSVRVCKMLFLVAASRPVKSHLHVYIHVYTCRLRWNTFLVLYTRSERILGSCRCWKVSGNWY